jgi:hypothetical protein
MRMRTSFALPFLLLALPAQAADMPQPGLWKQTVTSITNGQITAQRADERCLTTEQFATLEKSFAPEEGGTCTRTVPREWTGRKLSWSIACTLPIKMENSGSFEFDTPTHYTGEITVKMIVPGGVDMLSQTRLEGQRVSDCQPR